MGAQGFVSFGHELSLTTNGTHGNTPSRIKLDQLGSSSIYIRPYICRSISVAVISRERIHSVAGEYQTHDSI